LSTHLMTLPLSAPPSPLYSAYLMSKTAP
jgi:hypothetical protein